MAPTMKFSDNPEKSTNPGVKELFRLYDDAGFAVADVITLQGETIEPGKPATFHHPSLDTRRFNWVPCGAIRSMLGKVMEGGHRLGDGPDFVKLAGAYGLRATAVTRRADVADAVNAARQHPGAALIDCAKRPRTRSIMS